MCSSPTSDHNGSEAELPDSGVPVAANGYGRIKRIRRLHRTLPGRAMAAAMVVNGELWVVMDPEKADAPNQARRMLTAFGPHVTTLLAHMHLLL